MSTEAGPGPATDAEQEKRRKESRYWADRAAAFGAVLRAEEELLKTRRAIPPLASNVGETEIFNGDGAVGLAISGGGIRSATFGLGILQYLAARDLLRQVDYLSTVSGGGYIGSSLTWFLHGRHGLTVGDGRAMPGLGPADFPYGTAVADRRVAPPEPENAHLRYLRRRGRYLTPGQGITIASGVGVALRGAALNFLVWGPIATLGFLLLFAFGAWVSDSAGVDSIRSAAFRFLADAVRIDAWIDGIGWQRTVQDFFSFLAYMNHRPSIFTFHRLELALYALAGLFMACSVFYSLWTHASFKSTASEKRRYRARREFEIFVRWALGIATVLLVLLSIPYAARHLGGAISSGVFLSGLVGGAATFAHTLLDGESKLRVERYAPLVAAMFLYGFGLIAYIAAVAIYDGGDHIHKIFAQLLVLGAITGALVNINLISLHRFYRDRLMEAFLPDKDKTNGGMSNAAEVGYLHEMADPARAKGPYHLINTHLITTNVEHLDEPVRNRLKLRGGDNFVLAPLHCGATATGWQRTVDYAPILSLATAMAISGAAANPNAGVGGMGVTRSRSVALVMALLNVRLGYWLPNPASDSRFVPRYCNHFSPGLGAAFAEFAPKPDTKRRWIQLSDGGHFDNTGMYELLRRRMGLILFCDGSADPEYRFEDLHNVLERAHKDFGIVVEFLDGLELKHMMPRRQADERYPRRLRCSLHPFAVARIAYPRRIQGLDHGQAAVGTLVVMSTVVTRHASLAVLAHKDVHRDFPDESTMDQFFEEGQFESYRELGWNNAWIAMTMLDVTASPKGLRIPAYDPGRAVGALRQKLNAKQFL